MKINDGKKLYVFRYWANESPKIVVACSEGMENEIPLIVWDFEKLENAMETAEYICNIYGVHVEVVEYTETKIVKVLYPKNTTLH
jgi:hypothetical protein